MTHTRMTPFGGSPGNENASSTKILYREAEFAGRIQAAGCLHLSVPYVSQLHEEGWSSTPRITSCALTAHSNADDWNSVYGTALLT
jgi:hypothetical protein